MEVKIAGKYTIERKLGEGANGRIYLGKDTETGELVAMKLVS
jgi:serine/threonine protein kinase